MYGWTYPTTASSRSRGGRLSRGAPQPVGDHPEHDNLRRGSRPEGPGRPPALRALVSVRDSMYLHGPFLRKLTLAPCSDSVFTNLFTARSTSASDASVLHPQVRGECMGSAALYPILTATRTWRIPLLLLELPLRLDLAERVRVRIPRVPRVLEPLRPGVNPLARG